jgi:PglZ domain
VKRCSGLRTLARRGGIVASEIRVTLINDPFGICPDEDNYVSDFPGELRAFRDIEDLLRRDARFETVQPRTYGVAASCWEHFRSFRGVTGVSLVEVTPRTRVREALHAEPPDWLTNQQILDWGLLGRPAPKGVPGDWPAVIAAWLLPGILDVESLDDWLKVSAAAQDFPRRVDPGPVADWFRDSLSAAASKNGLSRDVIHDLVAALEQAGSPVEFARSWLRRRALLPLAEWGGKNPLRTAGLDIGTVQQRALARRLPLVFPLPETLHKEVCERMRRAVQTGRVQYPGSFEDAVLHLNALWDGVAEELAVWLEMEPRGMTVKAAAHLESLPGYTQVEVARHLVTEYSPPDPVAAWPGLEDGAGFDTWVVAYARYVRRCFFRRELPAAEADPAASFGRWLKDHETVSFVHLERGYGMVAHRVQRALKAGRAVIVVSVDALAAHIVNDAVAHLNDQLRAEPTWRSHVFAPVPTVTAVCKAAVLTGALPDACGGDLIAALSKAYRLNSSELQVSASWQDAERLRITPMTRLVVYRENRVDDQLHSTVSYRVLLEDCTRVFVRLSQLVARWLADFRCLNRVSPLVLLTADHGFTYGPPPGKETKGHRHLNPAHRCIEIEGSPQADELSDSSLTLIDKDRFHLPRSYLAARGRYFGSGTASGWALSHGGLLPEEVIIPVIEWFGDEASLIWPTVVFPDGAAFDGNRWLITCGVRNPHSRPLPSGSLIAGISGSGRCTPVPLPRLESGRETVVELELQGPDLPEGEKLPVEVILRLRAGPGGQEVERADEYLVPRARRLVERTAAQDDFEEMF